MRGTPNPARYCAKQLTWRPAHREAWRYQGPFTRYERFKRTLPGLGTATVLFSIYCGYEYFFLEDEHHHGEAHH